MKDIILHGDAYACLEQLDNSIAVAITSPPYWKQRDYGFEEQIGQERMPEAYIGRLVKVFSKLRQKLRDDGIFFLNVGDKYQSQYGKSHLLQIPYRLAYHMMKDGWRLEDVMIWFKTNHMPSPVKDRFTNTYEPVLVFSKCEHNIYKRSGKMVVKIPLQQTPWKHTAVFPEMLVEEMLDRVNIMDEDRILDLFAGTGTVAVVVRRRRSGLFPKRIYSIMIEKGDKFIPIIEKRADIRGAKKVSDISYDWKPIEEEKLPDVEPCEILTNKNGEIFIAQNSDEFLSALRGITNPKFYRFHREDALYFYGVRNWSLSDLYYISRIYQEGYVLRNMLVISNHKKWYPIFMFSRDSTRVAYKFYLDRVRRKPKTEENRDWLKEEFVGTKVRDISGKETRKGWIIEVLQTYDDGFPKIVVVQWDGYASVEVVLHPERDEILMEGLIFRCPKCRAELEEPYDPAGENLCSYCGGHLWEDKKTLPLVEEPKEIMKTFNAIEEGSYYSVGEILKIDQIEKSKITTSKFSGLKRINWGASPGARKLMLGEYFTKMRLYRVDQPTIAQYLTILRKSKGMSLQAIIDKLPKEYTHTVGHWFRKDFGGSTPIPEDVRLLKEILGSKNSILDMLEKSGLKFQTVKASVKGRNPGDFIENINSEELIAYLTKLFAPSQQYTEIVK
ncbi:MAG: site-specific DNA-methyltransferase [Candidatus Helarchaeota archaeon]|nr:site-specific DNA-methyltransferase [Candidatus Helarchaeota archaeon]